MFAISPIPNQPQRPPKVKPVGGFHFCHAHKRWHSFDHFVSHCNHCGGPNH